MAGICTSAITHDVSFKWVDCRNSSADANVWTMYPCELRRLFVAARTDASSSMTEITESVDKTVLPDAGTARACLGTAAQSKMWPRIKIVKSYLGLYAGGLRAANSERLSHSDQIGHRPRAHFFHNVAPMDLHGNLGKSKFGCYLFVHQAGCD
jgi:hypothetical protein